MKLKHILEIKTAIENWFGSGGHADLDGDAISIVCIAIRLNWEIFYAAKVGGNSISYLASELCPYLTTDQITEALMVITGVDGSGIKGSGVKW